MDAVSQGDAHPHALTMLLDLHLRLRNRVGLEEGVDSLGQLG